MTGRASGLLGAMGPALLALAIMALPGCAGDRRIAGHAKLDLAEAPLEAVDETYHLQPGDSIAVRFINTPEMNITSMVMPEGTVSLLQAPDVKVGGKTVEEARGVIAAAYAGLLNPAELAVSLVGVGAKGIAVGGDVRNTGLLRTAGGMTLSQVIIAVGGLNNTADSRHVMVLHYRDNAPVMSRVDYHKVIIGQGVDADFRLLPGDVVFVPRSRIGTVDAQMALFYSKLPAYLTLSRQVAGGTSRYGSVVNSNAANAANNNNATTKTTTTGTLGAGQN